MNKPKNVISEGTFNAFDTLNSNEVDIVKKVQQSSLVDQAKIDMELHDSVQDCRS